MDDKQIIELYWNRSGEAIQETKEKYGLYCSYIAHHILQEEAVAERCVEECYAMIWDSIPPRKPQNLKVYLCKITRNHALYMRYPELNEQATDLFTAELIIQDFLKDLESEQRKLFVAHYWYFVPVSEIALQYKKSENKVNTTLVSLRQKLDVALEQKGIHLQNEAELFYAMTEVDDQFLEEVIVIQEQSQSATVDTVKAVGPKWRMGAVGVAAAVLILAFMMLLWSKNTLEQNPTESELASGTEESESTIIIDEENIIYSYAGPMMSKDGFAEWLATLPWNQEKEVSMLPIYKNLAYVSKAGETVYLEEEILVTMVREMVSKLNMEEQSLTLEIVHGDEKNYAGGLVANTDLGSIRVNGRGEVFVSYTNGVKLMNGSVMSHKATVQEANEAVTFLSKQYAHLFSETKWIPSSYEEYDSIDGVDFTRKMNYKMVDGNGAYPLVEYYFNQVSFDYDEELGMTSIHYGDVRTAAELLGYYPVISYEEAKELLLQGHYIPYNLSYRNVDGVEKRTFSDSDQIKAVELMYDTSATEEYYQPYYCFYVELAEQPNFYYKYYVPAIRSMGLDGIPPYTYTAIDMTGYEKINDLWYRKKDIDYMIENGKIVEIGSWLETGERIDYSAEEVLEETEDGVAIFFKYNKGADYLNLTQLMKDVYYRRMGAWCVEGKVFIICKENLDELNDELYTTCYVYSKENNSLKQTVSTALKCKEYEPFSQKGNEHFFTRYIANVKEGESLTFIDVLDGSITDSGVASNDVKTVFEASKDYFAVVFKTGKIGVFEKKSGILVMNSVSTINFTPNAITYKDGTLYIEPTDAGNALYVVNLSLCEPEDLLE